jgi:Flp pilus assembly protein TadD/Zn-dependent protease with chaperone function
MSRSVSTRPPHASPPTQLRRALLFATAGYVYIAAVLAAMLLFVVLLARIKAGALVGLPVSLVIGILFALRVRFHDPLGRRITRVEAPALFRAIDRARARLGAPEVDVVLLTTDLNAGVLEKPRFGIPGFWKRHLTIGLPLLYALSEDEIRAILAHEFAHLSRQHSRLWLWLERASATWKALAAGSQASGGWASPFIFPFFRWYAPRLEQRMQAVSREHERESDRLAGRAAGPETAARSLLRLMVARHLVERSLLPDTLRPSARHAAPPADAYPGLLRALAAAPSSDSLRAAVAEVLRDRTLESNTHPSCAERVEAFGVPADVETLAAALAQPRVPAAGTLLEPAFAQAIGEELGALWNEEVRPLWARCHADARVWQSAAEEGAALWARARWSADCDPDAAVPLLRRVLAAEPEHTEAAVLLGTLLIRSEDEDARQEGVGLLEGESARATLMAPVAAALLLQHYARMGRAANVRRMQARAQELRDEALRALRERQELTPRDTLRPYALPPALHGSLVAALAGHAKVKAAFLVQKRTRWMDQSPQVVLAVEIAVPWYRFSRGSRARKVCVALLAEVRLPDTRDLLVTPVERPMLRRLRGIPGAEIYRRDAAAPAAAPVSDAWSAPPRWRPRMTGNQLAWGTIVLAMLVGMVARAAEGRKPDTPEEWERALPGLIREAREDTHDAGAQADLAWALIELERWKDAEPAMARASELTPERVDVLNALGWLRVMNGDPAGALAPLQRAVQLEPENAEVRHNLGRAYAQLGQPAIGERWYREALRLDFENAELNADLGWALVDQGRLDEAEGQFQIAVRMDQTAPNLRSLAEAQRRRGRLQEAIATLTRAAELAPLDAALWADLGHTEFLTGDAVAADAAFARAARLDATYFAANPYRRELWDAARAGRTSL